MTRPVTAYWVITAIVTGECLVGGAMDLFRLAPFYPMLLHLGYPGYLATILGVAKIAAGVVLLLPGLPRLKEWAYAGVVINMAGAVASHVATRDAASDLLAPAAFTALAVASWALRPPARRLAARPPAHPDAHPDAHPTPTRTPARTPAGRSARQAAVTACPAARATAYPAAPTSRTLPRAPVPSRAP
ncbi:DoxX family protein [Actinomadura sp. ATCC 31491]|uniref:DoxX family protein n=1 Tax=Actinomadura luzonensis TaxID=2805427 RepID=A0ABT0G301_9ACTN|nr:DoxX family protein [Actinomadura luzonensis]MCK2218503.1 DoxX family protein [Actinomadura luzonensis]